jgi:two-component system cell cycle sensor histidine kinase/response regulator CckA
MSYRLFISFSGHNKPDHTMLALPEQSRTGDEPPRENGPDRARAVERLAAGIAHHFNNAFQSIISATELAYFHADSPELVKEDLTRIAQQSKQAAQLARQLLDFSCQPITGQRRIDLASLIQELANLLKITLPPEVCFSLDIESAPEAYAVTASPGQIRQALITLVANAQEAMPAGGLVELGLGRFNPPCDGPTPWSDCLSDQWLVLSVCDTGRGIPPDDLPHIFDPFFTTKPIGQGAGLGLAQMYGIVKQHNGKIEVQSELGQGTTISLYLPVRSISEPEPTQRSVDERFEETEPLMLLIDDPVKTQTSAVSTQANRVLVQEPC